MDERTARHLLDNTIRSDDSLRCGGQPFVVWTPGMEEVFLDGEFTADQLEALAWWMRAKGSKESSGG